MFLYYLLLHFLVIFVEHLIILHLLYYIQPFICTIKHNNNNNNNNDINNNNNNNSINCNNYDQYDKYATKFITNVSTKLLLFLLKILVSFLLIARGYNRR